MKAKPTVAVFLLLLGGLAVFNALSPVREYSEQENRYLQQWPPFSARALVSGKFTADIDTFVTDQFAYRDGWVGVKTLAERTIGKKDSGGVYFGEDGYLIEMFDAVDMEQYRKNLDAVQAFSQRMEEGLSVPVSTMLVPTASHILRDKLPTHIPEVAQDALLAEAEAALPGYVDMVPVLEAHREEDIYYRTDHHWTSLGAFYCYEAWRGQRGESTAALADYDTVVLSREFFGTTYSKASLYTAEPDTMTAYVPKGQGSVQVDYNQGETVTDSIYESSYLGVKDKYSVFLNANQAVTKVTTGVSEGGKLLIIKDSYANTLVQFALTDYSEIHVIDPRYFKQSIYEYAGDNGVTDALVLYNIKNFAGDTNIFYLTT